MGSCRHRRMEFSEWLTTNSAGFYTGTRRNKTYRVSKDTLQLHFEMCSCSECNSSVLRCRSCPFSLHVGRAGNILWGNPIRATKMCDIATAGGSHMDNEWHRFWRGITSLMTIAQRRGTDMKSVVSELNDLNLTIEMDNSFIPDDREKIAEFYSNEESVHREALVEMCIINGTRVLDAKKWLDDNYQGEDDATLQALENMMQAALYVARELNVSRKRKVRDDSELA
mmetsp:Transcript_13713/g.47526  ORF Transcript_13713/g.47526 Transcript_13713/m.47526 type:complete len:226 (-) Transcript_13713:203-880(-)